MQNDEDFPLTTAASITSEFDSIDDLNYFEWEKERRLFQEYIASLRKEIRVLLQERFEYRTNTSDDESTKIELLQKCLEEKNLLIEQYQNENDLLKEKNNNFNRQISVHKAENKSHLTMIDESKQKIIDLTIDLENHQMVKRRFESSIHNLEEECRLIDGERQKLLEDLKESQHAKQQMEKTLQMANVQIAEQGSTIEMLRAENIQVRSQLASIQRRMFQEKQQIIDYLRQIENDLIEKERIEKQCRNLQMQIDRLNEENATKLRTNFDELFSLSQSSNVDEMIETIRNRWIDERKTHDELQKELMVFSTHCAQLEFANQSWQQFQEIQMENLRKKFDSFVSIRSDSSFDEILQLIVDELSQLQRCSSSSNDENLEESLRETFREYINDDNDDDLVRQIQNGFEQRCQTIEREYQMNLETIRQSYVNTVNELNQEIDILKQQREDQTCVEFSTPIDLNEISSLSIDEISSRLNNECRQILSNESLLPTDQLIPLAFYTIKYLHNQYLVAQAKDMYNDTVIRALKDEFEVLLVEKNDLAEQFEKVKSETSSQINTNEKSFDDIPMVRHEQFEHIKDEEKKGSDWTEDEDLFRSHLSDVEKTKSKFEIIEDRLERPVVESSSLFSEMSNDPIDRLDQLIKYFREKKSAKVDAETQSDDQALNKQIQINQKLKRALQTIKEKIQRFVHERPEDFSQTTDETIERLEQIFTLIHRQTIDIDRFKEILREKNDELQNALNLNEEKQTQLNHLENELNHLRSTMPSPAVAEDFQMFSKLVEEQAEQLKNLTEENQSIAYQLQSQTEFYQQQNEKLKKQLIEYQDEIAKRRLSLQERADQESQTDNQQYEKIVQMNNKMKRFLQTFKEKIQHFVAERPDLFDGVGEETNERLDHLISTIPSIEHRLNAQIDHWKRSFETLQNQLDSEEKLQAVQLKQSISQNDEERNRLHEQVERLEIELKKCQDENETLNQQHLLQLGQTRDQIEQVEATGKQTIQERDDQIKDLKTQLDTVLSERQSLEMQLEDYQRLLQEMANKVDRESQTDNQQYEKIIQMNNKMKRFLQTFKEKIQHFVAERPDLFDGVGEETNERLDHLISTIPSIENRLNAQIDHWKQSFDALQNLHSQQLTQSLSQKEAEHNQLREQLQQSQDEKNVLIQQHSLQQQHRDDELQHLREQMHKLTSERDELQERVDELSIPSVVKVDKQSQIDHSDYESMSKKLREMAEERSDLFDGVGQDVHERLSHLISMIPSIESRLKAEVEHWKKSCEVLEERIDVESKLKVEHLQQASNTESSVQQLQRILSDKEDERKLIRQRLNELEIELRKTLDENQKLVQDKKSLIEKHSEMMEEKEEQLKLAEESASQSKESCESLLQQRDQQCFDLQRFNDTLSKEKDDLARRINEYQRRIELLTIPAVETVDGVSQTDDRGADELSGKIAEFAISRADLFENVGEETSDRIDHLMSMIPLLEDQKRFSENQQHEIGALKQIISEKEEERDLIRQQLDEAERELKKVLNENAKLIEEKNAMIHEHNSQTESSQHQYETIERSAQQTAAKIEKLEILLGQRDNELEELEERVQSLTIERDEFRKTVDRLASQLEEVVHERHQTHSHDHQSLLDQLQRIVTDRPDLFACVGDEAKARLDHLITTIPLIENRLKTEVDYWKKSCETLEDQMESEQKLKVEHLQQASNNDSFIQQLQRAISDKEEQQQMTRQQLDKVEIELRKALDENRRLLEEKEGLIYQYSLKLEQQQSELDTSRETLRDSTEKIEKLESLLEDRDAALESFDEQTRMLKSQKNDLEQQVVKLTVQPTVTSEIECQTDNQHYEKLVEKNKKMKRHLQALNGTIGNVISERPEFFEGVGQDVHERLSHLISLIPSIESRLIAEVEHWKKSCEALEERIDAESKLKVEHLQQASNTQSTIEQLQHTLSEKDQQRAQLQQRFDELQTELTKSLDDNKQLLQHKETLINEHSSQLDQQQQQIETMSQKIEKLESLLEQRDAALEKFDEENRSLASQRNELEEQVGQLTVAARVMKDDECQTDNSELKKMEEDVSEMKEKMEKVVKERGELFAGVGEELNERVSRLIESMGMIDQWKKSCESLQQRLNAEERSKLEQLEKLSNSETLLKQLEEQISEKEEKLKIAEESVLQCKESCESLLKQRDQRCDTLQQINDTLIQEKDSLIQQIQLLTIPRVETVDEEKWCRKIADFAETRVDLFENVGEALSDRIDHLVSMIPLLEEQKKSLQAELQLKVDKLEETIIEKDEEQNLTFQRLKYLIDKKDQEKSINTDVVDEIVVKPIGSPEEKCRLDRECQTENIREEKLVYTNRKLKGILQNIKEKLENAVVKHSELFEEIGDDPEERIEHLISLVRKENHTSPEVLRSTTEQLDPTSIEELKRNINDEENQLNIIREQLRDVEFGLKKTIEEKEALLLQHSSELKESRNQIENLTQEIRRMTDEVQQTQALIDQRDSELKHLREENHHLMSHSEELKQQIEQLTVPSTIMIDKDSQIDHHDYQRLSEKVQRIAQERPDLFDGVSEETNERLDHLISTIPSIEHRLNAQIDHWKQSFDALQNLHSQQLTQSLSQKEAEHNQLREQLQQSQDEKNALIQQHSLQQQHRDDELQHLREQMHKLTSERDELQERVDELSIPSVVKVDKESQIDHSDYESMSKKLREMAEERSDLFDGVGQDVEERLSHLISMIPSIESRLKAEVEHWKKSCEALEERIDVESKLKVEHLQQASNTQSNLEQLQHSLSEKDQQRAQLQQRFDELQTELTKSLDDNKQLLQHKETLITEHSSQLDQQQQQIQTMSQKIEKLESLLEQRDAALEKFDEENRSLTSQRNELEEQVGQLTVAARVMKDDECQTDNSELKKMEEDVCEMKDKMEKVVKERGDLFVGVGEELSDRVDRLIESMGMIDQWKNSCESQRMEMESEKKLILERTQQAISEKDENIRKEINEIKLELKKAIDEKEVLVGEQNECREELESLRRTVNELEALKKELDDLKEMKEKIDEFINERSDLFDNVGENLTERLDHFISILKSQCRRTTENPLESIEDRRVSSGQVASTNLKKNQSESFVDLTVETTDEDGWFDASPDVVANETTTSIESKIRRFIVDHSSLFRNESTNLSEDVDQLLFVINELDEELRRYVSSPMNLPTGHDVNTQTLGLSIVEEHRKQIENLQDKLARLESERTHSVAPLQHDVEIQTIENNDSETTTTTTNGISRRIFEEEMLASSKEIQQLKRLVKQMKVENEKIKEINRKFETIAQNVLHENQQLKRENNDKRISLPPNRFDDVSSDEDICYLTLKCLTYEVSNQTSIDQQIEEDFSDCQRQLRQTRLQNERLKNQIENYKKQFEQIQTEMSKQIDQMTKLKDETEKLRSSEIQIRSENDRLKSNHYDQQLRIQQLERELNNSRRTNLDERSRNNLEELVQLKEREIVALKEKFDRTVEKHRIELEESMKSKQFSLEHVKRLEQIDQRHQQTRRSLEKKLSQFCRLTRPLTQRFDDLIELKSLIDQTENEERVNSSLGPIRDCLSLLEAQMKDLHHNIIENHARRSKKWKYRLGFECLSCESRWEVTHDIRDLQEACSDPSRFLESSIVEPMAGCSCPIMIDFVESDVRLCLDDLVDDVIEQISSTVN